MKADPELRLCGKRIQMHCDADGDKSISEREWDACLGVKEGERNTWLMVGQKMYSVVQLDFTPENEVLCVF